MLGLSDLDIRRVADATPDGLALVLRRREYSYAQLAALVEQRLQSSEKAEVSALLCEPTLEGIVGLFASLASQVATLLVHPRWTRPYCDALFERVGAQIFAQGERIERLPYSPSNAIDPNTAIMLGTSGSTGAAKIVQHSRASLFAAAESSERNLTWCEGDRWLLSLPFAHVGGLSVLVRCVLARIPIVVGQGSFRDSTFIESIDESGATLYSLVPTQLHDLISLRAERGSLPEQLRLVLCGGAPAPLRLRSQAREHDISVLFTYGMTEAGSQVTTQPPSDLHAPPNDTNVGLPLPGVEVRVNADNRIAIRGENLMLGYLGVPRSQTFSDDGWFTTSDRGKLDSSGRLTLLGRTDHLLITGGENVDPEWVEQCLLGCPLVREVALLGIDDARWGDLLVALVVPESLLDSGSMLEGVAHYAREHLPGFAVPKKWFLVDGLPKLGIGKLDRSRLKALVPT